MRIEKFEYQDFALKGFDSCIKIIFPPHEFLAIGCHKGVRRSRVAAAMLFSSGYPVVNNMRIFPSICYADFLEYNFSVTDEGLSIPDKTISPFRNLLLFHDGGQEEIIQIRRIKQILKVEARGILDKLAFANVRDESSLIGIA
ncbi:MAG: hypothetical protein AAB874_06590 [Patescibacteria group bacterium]